MLASWLLVSALVCSAAAAQPRKKAAAPAPVSKMRVLLDTDAFNEIDDQFFIAYSFFEKRLEIEGVAAAHYRWENGSVDESYHEILRVLRIMGVKPKIPIVRGADKGMPDHQSPLASSATDLIYKLAMKDDPRPLNILAVGALTNVASALLLHPEIKSKVRVIWLGGFPPDGRIVEFNAANDRAAVKAVFESGVDLTVVPTETCARYLTLPYEEARARLRHTNLLGEYLLGLVRDYGDRNKIIWDISVTAYALQAAGSERFFEVEEEPAPVIDMGQAKYIRRQGPHKIKVCQNANRDAVFASLFRHIPQPNDTEPPYPLLAVATGDLREVRVWFSEPVKPDVQFLDYPQRTVQTLDEQTVQISLLNSAGPKIVVKAAADTAGNALLRDRDTLPVLSASGAKPGLKLKVYKVERGLKEMPQASGDPIYEGVTPTLAWPSLNLPQEVRRSAEATLVVAEGFLYLPIDHRYEFDLVAHRLARVYLDGKLLLDQGTDGDRRARRTTFRKAGLYPIRVEQYVEPGRFDLTMQWNLPFHDSSLIPDAALLHR